MFTRQRPQPAYPEAHPRPTPEPEKQQEKSIHDLSFLELKAFHEHVGQILAERAAQARQAFREDFLAKLSDYGMSLDDFKPEPPKKERKKRELKAKYRHPETGEEWSGRGRPPLWMQEYLAQGRHLEEFVIEMPGATIA